MDNLEIDRLFSEALADVAVTQIIRPSAILPETEAKIVLANLAQRDARAGGLWSATPSLWERYDRPWDSPTYPGGSQLVGSINIVFDSPHRYQITIYRATLSIHGHDQGWSVNGLCDEALGFAGLSLDTCPRADLKAPPPVFPNR